MQKSLKTFHFCLEATPAELERQMSTKPTYLTLVRGEGRKTTRAVTTSVTGRLRVTAPSSVLLKHPHPRRPQDSLCMKPRLETLTRQQELTGWCARRVVSGRRNGQAGRSRPRSLRAVSSCAASSRASRSALGEPGSSGSSPLC